MREQVTEYWKSLMDEMDSWPSVPEEQCAKQFDVDGETYVCSFRAGHDGGCGRVALLIPQERSA